MRDEIQFADLISQKLYIVSPSSNLHHHLSYPGSRSNIQLLDDLRLSYAIVANIFAFRRVLNPRSFPIRADLSWYIVFERDQIYNLSISHILDSRWVFVFFGATDTHSRASHLAQTAGLSESLRERQTSYLFVSDLRRSSDIWHKFASFISF